MSADARVGWGPADRGGERVPNALVLFDRPAALEPPTADAAANSWLVTTAQDRTGSERKTVLLVSTRGRTMRAAAHMADVPRDSLAPGPPRHPLTHDRGAPGPAIGSRAPRGAP
ncbi:hypothetical protein GCM10010302_32040 [Streptomyces polychromogenes]|uniref:Uncharacterized protein n=1 Tax=Streptomyces polychromogenes TaxID=67342 RepID=A0ABP3F3Y8_9ACTN